MKKTLWDELTNNKNVLTPLFVSDSTPKQAIARRMLPAHITSFQRSILILLTLKLSSLTLRNREMLNKASVM
jgi:hypothetical protein